METSDQKCHNGDKGYMVRQDKELRRMGEELMSFGDPSTLFHNGVSIRLFI